MWRRSYPLMLADPRALACKHAFILCSLRYYMQERWIRGYGQACTLWVQSKTSRQVPCLSLRNVLETSETGEEQQPYLVKMADSQQVSVSTYAFEMVSE